MSNWILIDDSHPRFDRWQHTEGYIESFWKGQNPNTSYDYGMFGDLVKDYCLQHGITQGEFADRVGVCRSTFGNYVGGRNKPTPDVIARIESITGLKIV